MNYTKGGWRRREPREGMAAEVIENFEGRAVALAWSLDDCGRPMPPEEVIANAQLIASAPLLYKLVKAIAEMEVLPISYIELAKQALAKAEEK